MLVIMTRMYAPTSQAKIELRQHRLVLSRCSSLAAPLLLFLAVVGAYCATVLGILVTGTLAALMLVPLCGMLVIALFVIGHDACHQSYTCSRFLNHVIGRVAFLPALHSFSLWDREHNHRHHRFNNIRCLDYAWIPLDPAEYAHASLFQRLKYRLYRNPAGVLLYYLLEIWPQRKLWPRRVLVGRIRPAYIADSVLLAAFVAASLLLIDVGGWFGKSAFEAFVLAFVLPFLIFQMMFSVAIFLHHTHHDVPWYASVEEWEADGGGVRGTVHVEFPYVFRKIILHIMEHTVHHYAPGVPLYKLGDMQERIERHGPKTWRFSFREYAAVCARCKLFDYATHSWFNFEGRRTSFSLDVRLPVSDGHRPCLPLPTR
jgi:omega-6 fatty acid desaturase (delta-12 desaturase)